MYQKVLEKIILNGNLPIKGLFYWVLKMSKNDKIQKIGEIHGFKKDIDKEVLETLENQGLLIVDDDERNEDWKVYHILKEV